MTGGPSYRGDAECNRSTSCGQAASGDLLPREFPPCGTVHHYFQAWQNFGVWIHLNPALRTGPSSCRTGSLSIGGDHGWPIVKTTERGGARGFRRAKAS
jgi:transposase